MRRCVYEVLIQITKKVLVGETFIIVLQQLQIGSNEQKRCDRVISRFTHNAPEPHFYILYIFLKKKKKKKCRGVQELYVQLVLLFVWGYFNGIQDTVHTLHTTLDRYCMLHVPCGCWGGPIASHSFWDLGFGFGHLLFLRMSHVARCSLTDFGFWPLPLKNSEVLVSKPDGVSICAVRRASK